MGNSKARPSVRPIANLNDLVREVPAPDTDGAIAVVLPTPQVLCVAFGCHARVARFCIGGYFCKAHCHCRARVREARS